MMKTFVATIVATGALATSAIAGEYNHQDWPVRGDGNGGYAFTSQGQSRAVSLCAAYYSADLAGMEEHNNTAGQLDTVLKNHARTMRDAYLSRFSGDSAQMEEMTADMTWHFGNSAQYGVFQEFKDSANAACESYGLENGIVSLDYLNEFNEKLLSAI